jgi:hypothetical protein
MRSKALQRLINDILRKWAAVCVACARACMGEGLRCRCGFFSPHNDRLLGLLAQVDLTCEKCGCESARVSHHLDVLPRLSPIHTHHARARKRSHTCSSKLMHAYRRANARAFALGRTHETSRTDNTRVRTHTHTHTHRHTHSPTHEHAPVVTSVHSRTHMRHGSESHISLRAYPEYP